MCARRKQKRIEEARHLTNVFDMMDEDVKIRLDSRLRGNDNIVLELGCGSGDYTLEMAKMYPKTLFIGIDIQGERLWMGATKALKEEIDNVIFLRIQIENLEEYFTPKSVDEIWTTFPDPYPTKKQIKKRLTSPRFLEMYKNILKPNGILHLKTDNSGLFDYSLASIADFGGQIISCSNDVDNVNDNPLLQIRTYFENKHRARGTKIKYLRATL